MSCIAPEVPMNEIFRGIIAFTIYDLMLVGLITAYPIIALWLPRTM